MYSYKSVRDSRGKKLLNPEDELNWGNGVRGKMVEDGISMQILDKLPQTPKHRHLPGSADVNRDT